MLSLITPLLRRTAWAGCSDRCKRYTRPRCLQSLTDSVLDRFRRVRRAARRTLPADLRPAQSGLSAVRAGAAASAPRPRPAARRSPSACGASARRSCCRRRSAASSSARRSAARSGVRAIFAERQDGRLTLRRGFTLAPGERVLVVEDVVTTGGSTRETIDVARARRRARSWARVDHRPQRRAARASTCRITRWPACRCRRISPSVSAVRGGQPV